MPAKVQLETTPIALAVVGDTLQAVEANGAVTTLDKTNLTFRNREVSGEFRSQLHRFPKTASIAKNGRIFFYDPDRNRCTIQGVSIRPELKKAAAGNGHRGTIEVCLLGPGGQTAVTGGTDGRVALWNGPFWEPGGKTFPRPDYVSALAFAPGGAFLAAGGFDGVLNIHDVATLEVVQGFRLSGPVEDVVFTSEETLVAVDRNGEVRVYHLQYGLIEKNRMNLPAWPTRLCLSDDGRHLVLGTRGGELRVLDAATGLSVFTVPLPSPGGVTALAVAEHGLFYGLQDGTVARLGTPFEHATLTGLLERRNFKKAALFIQERPWTLLHPATRAFDDHWNDALDRARAQLENGNAKVAEMILTPYLFDPVKRRTFEAFFREAELLQRLNGMVRAEQWPEALLLGEKHEILRYTNAYAKTLEHWHKLAAYLFSLADEDPLFYQKKIETLLRPYRLVPSKRTFVEGFIANAPKYGQAKRALADKDLGRFFQLVDHHPFLKETGLFDKIAQNAGVLLDKIDGLARNQEYDQALELTGYLRHLPDMKEQVAAMENEFRKRRQAESMLRAGNLAEAAKQLAASGNPVFCPEYKTLVTRFRKICVTCNLLVKQGRPGKLHPYLFPFHQAGLFRDKIHSLYEEAYLVELEAAARNGEGREKINRGANRFAALFGLSEETVRLFRELGVGKIREAHPGAAPEELPASIFEG